jgi:gas vesicle protein
MDEQLEVLRAIWGEMKGLNGRVGTTNERLDQTNQQLDDLRRELKTEMGELRGELKTEIGELRGQLKTEIGELRGQLKTEIGELRSELKTEIGELRSEVRDEVGALNVGVSGLRSDIDLAHHRSVDRDLRLGTSLSELSRDVRELTLVVHDWRDEHRLDREELRGRVERLERHAGLEPR